MVTHDLDFDKIVFYLQIFFEPVIRPIIFFFRYRPLYTLEAFLPEILFGFWILFLFVVFILRYKILKSNNSFFL